MVGAWVRTVVGAVIILLAGAFVWVRCTSDASDAVRRALSRRGLVALVGPRSAFPDAVPGTTFVEASQIPGLAAALRGTGVPGVAQVLTSAGVSALALSFPREPAARDSTLAHLYGFQAPSGLLGTYLSSRVALYRPDPLERMPLRYRKALAMVARRILAGEHPPRLHSFPPVLRKIQHVEVMVLLRAGPRPRLWRSARGSSIARAFLTAVRVAGQRWREREQAMGEPLLEALPRLTVEVSLLRDDGEIGDKGPAFIDRVVTERHGVAYEHKGGWRYLLPDAVAAQGNGSAARALGQLLQNGGLTADSYRQAGVRVVRLRVQRLATSPAPAAVERRGHHGDFPDALVESGAALGFPGGPASPEQGQ